MQYGPLLWWRHVTPTNDGGGLDLTHHLLQGVNRGVVLSKPGLVGGDATLWTVLVHTNKSLII